MDLRGKTIIHGKSRSKIYWRWENMIKRCNNSESTHYKNYGGRGIKVCKRWLKFENFYNDMGDIPHGLTLDRRDNDGNYELSNCRWATKSEQDNNRRTNVYIKYKGVTKTLKEWSDYFNLNYYTLRSRVASKWSIERILTTPTGSRKNKI
jgi:hypothetical protein